MKIKIAYGPGESLQAARVSEAIREQLPTVRVKESDAHPPYKHIYITTKEPQKA